MEVDLDPLGLLEAEANSSDYIPSNTSLKVYKEESKENTRLEITLAEVKLNFFGENEKFVT